MQRCCTLFAGVLAVLAAKMLSRMYCQQAYKGGTCSFSAVPADTITECSRPGPGVTPGSSNKQPMLPASNLLTMYAAAKVFLSSSTGECCMHKPQQRLLPLPSAFVRHPSRRVCRRMYAAVCPLLLTSEQLNQL